MTDLNLLEQAEREITKDLGGRARMLDGELAVMGANYQLICDMYKLAVRDRCSLLKLRKAAEHAEMLYGDLAEREGSQADIDSAAALRSALEGE